jgi:hypothetical protein
MLAPSNVSRYRLSARSRSDACPTSALSTSAACTRTTTSMVVLNANVLMAAVSLMVMVCCWSQKGNAVFNALAMKCFQLCFVTSVSSYAGTWVTTFGPR